jgi:hypothetical protein
MTVSAGQSTYRKRPSIALSNGLVEAQIVPAGARAVWRVVPDAAGRPTAGLAKTAIG